jgi:hypothetical protein
MKLNPDLQTARAALLETVIGPNPIWDFYSGPPPANITDPPSGTLLATLYLPADWLSDPVAGVANQVGSWQTDGSGAVGSGSPGYFRIYNSSKTVCWLQGTVGRDVTGSPSTNITSGSQAKVVGWVWRELDI